MAVIVAEYLGVRTDKGHAVQAISVSKNSANLQKPVLQCPFKNSHCDKAKQGNKPVCSIRDLATGELWIVCENRLCATQKGPAKSPLPLNEHQKIILHKVAREVFEANISRAEVLVKREVPIPVTKDILQTGKFSVLERGHLACLCGQDARAPYPLKTENLPVHSIVITRLTTSCGGAIQN